MKDKWEYDISTYSGQNKEEIIRLFNEKGAYGWELCTVDRSGWCHWKRKLSDEKDVEKLKKK